MGILSNIFHKIFPSSHPANTTTASAPAAPSTTTAPAAPAAPSAAPIAEVDVESILNSMSGAAGLNWRTSIVDLLKLLGGLGPTILSSIAGGALGNIFGGNNNNASQAPQISPEQASQMSPEQVQEIAKQAEQHNPGVMERMGEFYAQHPQLVKGLGGAALALVLGHMAQGMRRN